MRFIVTLASPFWLPACVIPQGTSGGRSWVSPALRHDVQHMAGDGPTDGGGAGAVRAPRRNSGNFNGNGNVGNFNGNGNSGNFNGNGNRSDGNGNGSTRDGTGNGRQPPDD